MSAETKLNKLRDQRKVRNRYKVKTSNRNRYKRISLNISNKYIYAQLIDDGANKTLFTLSSKALNGKKNKEESGKLAEQFYSKLSESKLESDNFIFDRGRFLYHGRIKVFADTLREKGIKV